MGGAIGRRLASLMRELAITQQELSTLSGVGQTEISRIKTGRRQDPSIGTVRALERGLGLPTGSLEMDAEAHPTLEVFLHSPERRALDPPLSASEILSLRYVRWFGSGEEPTVEAWADLIRARRKLQRGL